ncbi:MAG: hypothetical protein U0790_02725 [Isosphaeraceae bacterium]
MPGRPPIPTGLGLGSLRDPATSGRSTLHAELLREAARHPGEAVDPFAVAETFRHYILDRNIVGSVRRGAGGKEYIHRYKAYYVHAMRDPITSAAGRFGLPAVLVAGVVYNEVGGADLIKPAVFLLRELLSGSSDADRTSVGPASLQPRRAFAVLGYDPAKVDHLIRTDVVQALIHNHAFAIYVCAAHLAEIRERFFPGRTANELDGEAVAVLGARYNQGLDVPEERLRRDLSYGRRILDREKLLAKLLGEAPVAEPDWSEPLGDAFGRIKGLFR